MANFGANRQRAFADVVFIDAWHDQMSGGVKEADLHADVVFGTGRLGGESNSQVRFRLNVRRAELVVIIPEHEPFAVDKTSVARMGETVPVTRSFERESNVKGSLDAGLKFGAGAKGLSASADLDAKTSAEASLKETIKGSENLPPIKVVYKFQNADRTNRWSMESGAGPVLEGRPWDSIRTPLLKLVDTRTDRRKGLAPTVRVEIRCFREDLEISDIQLKDEPRFRKLLGSFGAENKLKAAEAYIRNELTRMGMDAGDISDKFARIILADVAPNNGSIG